MTYTLIDARPRTTPSRPAGGVHAKTAASSTGHDIGPLIDPFARQVTYLRLSVTDRCDLRCTYCMAEDMTFLPKGDVLSLDELDRLATAFVARGVRKLRLTGGEPLVRRGIADLVHSLSRHLRSGALHELTLTTNGTQLERHAEALARAGVRRINVSLDTLDPDAFRAATRRGDLAKVLTGIEAAAAAGLKVKLNAVLLRGINDLTLPDLIAWAHGLGHEVTVIETMPLGTVEEDRADRYMPVSELRRTLQERWTLAPDFRGTGGPARYVRVRETGGRIGFITPMSHTFCESCNRVRVTCTGQLYLCLGHEDGTALRTALREHPASDEPLHAALDAAILRKPKGHDFSIERGSNPASTRHMSVTGG